MPRETSRKANVRQEATLGEDRAVQLQSQRRFFSNQGNDRATRQARALTDAFGAGVNLSNTLAEKANTEGRREAITGRGAGEQRREDEKNEGYNAAWDQMDAEADLNLAKKELPEALRAANAEQLPEAEVQQLITEYMQGMFEGVTPDSAYGNIMAPGLLALEQGLLEEHRGQQIERVQQDQRSTMMDNVQNRFEASADRNALNEVIPGTEKFDYQYLGEQTNTFFDGSDKRTVYWESIYDFAIRNGRPDIIRNVPERFGADGKGDPTGINDPLMQDEHRAAEAAATSALAKRLAAEQAAADAANEQTIFDLQMAIYAGRQAGQDVSEYIVALASVPGVELTDISSSKNFGDSQLDERESRSGDLSYTSALWNQIHQGQAGIEQVWFAKTEGLLGVGPQSEDEMNRMMDEVKSMQSGRDALTTAEVTQYRSIVNKTYDPKLGGLLGAINPVMARVNIDATTMYNRLITEDGMTGWQALNAVKERFDPIVDNLPAVSEREIEGRRSQADFTLANISDEDIQAVVADPTKFSAVFGGVSPAVLEAALFQRMDQGTLTREQAIAIAREAY